MTAIGHPISGWAYKKKQSLITLAHDKVGSEFVDYLRAPSCANKESERIQSFLAIPLFFPFESNCVVGVMEIATCSDDDLIYRWNQRADDPSGDQGDDNESEVGDAFSVISTLINNKFLYFCKNSILS